MPRPESSARSQTERGRGGAGATARAGHAWRQGHSKAEAFQHCGYMVYGVRNFALRSRGGAMHNISNMGLWPWGCGHGVVAMGTNLVLGIHGVEIWYAHRTVKHLRVRFLGDSHGPVSTG